MDIVITRPKQFQGKIRSYYLYADGNKITKIKPNSSLVISVPSHTKFIQAKIDWCSSPKFYLDNSPSKKLIVKNRISGGFFKVLISPLYYITLGKNKYLKIESCK